MIPNGSFIIVISLVQDKQSIALIKNYLEFGIWNLEFGVGAAAMKDNQDQMFLEVVRQGILRAEKATSVSEFEYLYMKGLNRAADDSYALVSEIEAGSKYEVLVAGSDLCDFAQIFQVRFRNAAIKHKTQLIRLNSTYRILHRPTQLQKYRNIFLLLSVVLSSSMLFGLWNTEALRLLNRPLYSLPVIYPPIGIFLYLSDQDTISKRLVKSIQLFLSNHEKPFLRALA